MPTCFKCNEDKVDSEFAKWRSGHHSYCKQCRKTYDRDRYLSRHQEEIDRHKDKRTRNKERARELLHGLKSKPCMDCARSFPPVAMDFDHRDPATKKFDLAMAGSKGFSIKKILDEVAKCDVVCAVCHRLRTAKSWGRSTGCSLMDQAHVLGT